MAWRERDYVLVTTGELRDYDSMAWREREGLFADYGRGIRGLRVHGMERD